MLYFDKSEIIEKVKSKLRDWIDPVISKEEVINSEKETNKKAVYENNEADNEEWDDCEEEQSEQIDSPAEYVFKKTEWRATADDIEKFEKGSKKWYVDKLFREGHFENFTGFRKVLTDDLCRFGIDEAHNPFLRYVLYLPFAARDKSYEQKMDHIHKLYMADKIDLDMPELSNESLFDRDFSEFVYAINVFKTLYDHSETMKYFRDISVIDKDELFDGDIIKPSGIDRRQGDTIWNIVERWAKDNEMTAEERNAQG